MTPTLLRTAACAALACALWASPARPAGDTWHTCAGYIDSLPATVTTQGVWCLRADLATSIASGAAINVATNNVTIDCNDFRIDGSGAGNGTQATGLVSGGRQNTTVRNCRVQGFFVGIDVSGGGHLVEDNHLYRNRLIGILALGDNHVIRRNAIHATGGGTPSFIPVTAIFGAADILDNAVDGVSSSLGDTYGIHATGSGQQVRGNRVYFLSSSDAVHGIAASGSALQVAGNKVDARNAATGTGIDGSGAATACAGNTVTRFTIAYSGCESLAPDNVSLP